MFNFSFPILIKNILAWIFRDERMQAWLEVLLSPTQDLYNKFLAYKDDRLFFAKITGQVESLEFMLNKIFYDDGNLHHIYIDDGDKREIIYLFQKRENRLLYLYNKSENHQQLYLQNINGDYEFDFVIYVPNELVFDLNYMRSLVIQSKAAGFSFTIKKY